jgi:hypothetical protein
MSSPKRPSAPPRPESESIDPAIELLRKFLDHYRDLRDRECRGELILIPDDALMRPRPGHTAVVALCGGLGIRVLDPHDREDVAATERVIGIKDCWLHNRIQVLIQQGVINPRKGPRP